MFWSRSNYFNYRVVIKCLAAGRLGCHDIQQNLKVYMLALIIQKSAEHKCCITDQGSWITLLHSVALKSLLCSHA